MNIKKEKDSLNPVADQVEKIANKLMDVAVNGLVRWEESQNKKEEPNNEDVPF